MNGPYFGFTNKGSFKKGSQFNLVDMFVFTGVFSSFQMTPLTAQGLWVESNRRLNIILISLFLKLN